MNMRLGLVLVAAVLGMVVGVTLGQTTAPATTRASATAPAPATATAPAKRAVPVTIEGKADPRAPGYIVLFDEKVDAPVELARREKLYNFKSTHVYNMGTFKGFAAVIPAEAVEKLRWEPSIKSIEHDGVASING